MKALLLLALLLASTASLAQRPIPPGGQQADKAEQDFEKGTIPPAEKRVTVDFTKAHQDADELATLSNSIPADIDQVSKGLLSKDLDQKLKRIEKLAKQLRSQVSAH